MIKLIKKYKTLLFLSFLICLFYLSSLISFIPNNTYDYNVTIYRDTWGVPHIYGQSDEDAAYGLAYAHAEDDFTTILDILLASRGITASIKGKDSAPIDYLVGLLKIWESVEDKYLTLSPKIRTICTAYADGINKYIEKFPTRDSKQIYPVSGKDIIAGFALRTPLMYKLDWYITELMKDKKPDFSLYTDNLTQHSMHGSNVFAVSPHRSEDSFTRIAVNSHQPWVGPVTWYEAHIHSDEGWNITGGLFPGSPVVLKGYNENLAWSHTVNRPDLVDIYELTINPDNENQYLLDNNWADFEISNIPIKVKLFGPIKWTFNKNIYHSMHGPVLKTNHGVYAVRYSGHGLIGQVDQWYKMNKSKNLNEFKDAMKMMQIPMFNTVYADKSGNLFYLYNGLLPKRIDGYNWSGIVEGNKSELIWNDYYSYEELPQSTNPESGYLQNCNSTPYLATVGVGNPIKKLPSITGIEEFQSNRAYRANELYGQDLSISKEEFYTYKYDTYYSDKSVMSYARNRFINEFKSNDPILLDAINVLRNWDLGNQKDNTGAAIAQLTFKITYDRDDFKYDYNILKNRFIDSVDFLLKEFGKVDIHLGQLQILKRGELELPLDGGPDVLRAIYSKLENNRKIGTGGDCYFQMVEWDKNGNVSAESIHQFGSATLDENSPHYNDQAVLFSNMKMKPSFIKLEDIKNNLKISYKP
jgi:penicillin amidase/acyl-homoserine-lactone acylase